MLSTQEEVAADPAQEIERPKKSVEKRVRRKKCARVTVFANWCKGCGLCVAFCPQQVFEEDEESHPVVAHPERCTGCGWCTMHCPDFAIVVVMEDDLDSGYGQADDEMKHGDGEQ